jgi:hypothetical protein
MAIFSVAITKDGISMKSIDTDREMVLEAELVPPQYLSFLEKSIGKKPESLCKTGFIDIPYTSSLFGWFAREASISKVTSKIQPGYNP